jgi:hypothetical protein
MSLFMVMAFVIQCIGLYMIMIRLDLIQATLLKIQANDLERMIEERKKPCE